MSNENQLTSFEKELRELLVDNLQLIAGDHLRCVAIGEPVLVTTLTGVVSRKFGGFIGGVPHYFGKDSNMLFPETPENRIKRMPPIEWYEGSVDIPIYVNRVAVRAATGFISVVTREKVRLTDRNFSWLPLD